MHIEKNKVVTLIYELHIDDGDQEKAFFEKVDEKSPLVFLFGSAGFLPEFENKLAGKKINNSFEFSIDFEQAYGDYDEQKVMYLPKSTFIPKGKIKPPAGMLTVGTLVPMKDKQGRAMRAEILKVEADRVQVDFNHKLAGYDLFFKGKIIDLRDATAEEIAHGHVHGAHGHQHD